MKHILRSEQYDTQTLEHLFAVADKMEKKLKQPKTYPLKGKILASLFYEPSTRTRFSFESAMIRLGGSIIQTESAQEFSSALKGETLEDTIRVISEYADVIVLRHFEEGASEKAASVSKVPIINAGDGKGQHPTQGLLDLYTIKRERGKIDGLHIAMIGDLRHGRTVRSLCYLLGKYENIKISFASPKNLRMDADIKTYLSEHGVSFTEHEDMLPCIKEADIVYQTRIQKERHETSYKKPKHSYTIDQEIVNLMRDDAILLHPLPRLNEIHKTVDSSPKARYFKQAYYGLLIRMALLETVLK